MLVPAELTRGNAAHVNPAPQDVRTYAPLTHWANSPLTQASPLVQEEPAVSVLNWLLSAMACSPFDFRKLLSRGMYLGRANAAEEKRAVAAKTVVNFMLRAVMG